MQAPTCPCAPGLRPCQPVSLPRPSSRPAPALSQKVKSIFSQLLRQKLRTATLSHLLSSCWFVMLSKSSDIHPSFGHVSLLLCPSVSPDQLHDPLEQIGPLCPRLTLPSVLHLRSVCTQHPPSATTSSSRPSLGSAKSTPRHPLFRASALVTSSKHIVLSLAFLMP